MTTAEKPKRKPPAFAGFLVGSGAACGAVIFTNPLEVVKTKSMLQGELGLTAERQFKNPVDAFFKIARTEGLRGLQRGLGASMMTQTVMNGVRLGSYPQFKRLLLGENPPRRNFALMLLAGALSGGVSAILATPFAVVQTRLQAQTSGSLQLAHSYEYASLRGAYSTIWRQEGIRGFFVAWPTSAARTALGSAVQLSTYETSKGYIMTQFGLSDTLGTHFLASLLSGLAVVTAMNPLDVARTRLFAQARSGAGGGTLYTGAFDVIRKTVASEGPMALFKGWGAHYLRLGPHTTLTLMFMEQLKSRVERWYAGEP